MSSLAVMPRQFQFLLGDWMRSRGLTSFFVLPGRQWPIYGGDHRRNFTGETLDPPYVNKEIWDAWEWNPPGGVGEVDPDAVDKPTWEEMVAVQAEHVRFILRGRKYPDDLTVMERLHRSYVRRIAKHITHAEHPVDLPHLLRVLEAHGRDSEMQLVDDWAVHLHHRYQEIKHVLEYGSDDKLACYRLCEKTDINADLFETDDRIWEDAFWKFSDHDTPFDLHDKMYRRAPLLKTGSARPPSGALIYWADPTTLHIRSASPAIIRMAEAPTDPPVDVAPLIDTEHRLTFAGPGMQHLNVPMIGERKLSAGYLIDVWVRAYGGERHERHELVARGENARVVGD